MTRQGIVLLVVMVCALPLLGCGDLFGPGQDQMLADGEYEVSLSPPAVVETTIGLSVYTGSASAGPP